MFSILNISCLVYTPKNKKDIILSWKVRAYEVDNHYLLRKLESRFGVK